MPTPGPASSGPLQISGRDGLPAGCTAPERCVAPEEPTRVRRGSQVANRGLEVTSRCSDPGSTTSSRSFCSVNMAQATSRRLRVHPDHNPRWERRESLERFRRAHLVIRSSNSGIETYRARRPLGRGGFPHFPLLPSWTFADGFVAPVAESKRLPAPRRPSRGTRHRK